MSRMFQALCVATCAFAMLTAPASAGTNRQHQAVAVHYGDLNLSSEAGAKVLIRRVDQAARQACGVETGSRGLVRREQRRCRAEAMSEAIAEVNQPVVTTMFAELRGARTVFAAR